MKPLDLTPQEYRAFQRAHTQDTVQRFDFHLLTLSNKFVMSIPPISLGGQIDLDASAETPWALNATFLDPDHSLQVDSASPSDGVAGINRLLQVRRSLYVPDLDQWVSVPAFTGQPLEVVRNGATVVLRAYDISKRHLNSPLPYTIARGTPIVRAIRLILAGNGQTKFAFPSDTFLRAKLAKPLPVGGKSDLLRPWRVAGRLARQHGFDLIPGRDGAAILRRRPTSGAVMTLTERGDGAMLLERPVITTQNPDPINRVHVTSRRTVGKKKQAHTVQLSASANLKSTHAQSAVKLAAGGVPWVNSLWVEEDDLTHQTEVTARAAALLDGRSAQVSDIQARCIPFFHGDPWDLVRIEADNVTRLYRHKVASIPLYDGVGSDGTLGEPQGMTLGYQARVRDPRIGQARRHAWQS